MSETFRENESMLVAFFCESLKTVLKKADS